MADTDLARKLALTWSKPANPPRAVRHKQDNLFGIVFEDGFRATLEFAPAHMCRELDARMRWIEALADTGFACPWPQRTVSGDFLAEDKPQSVVAFMMQETGGSPIPAQNDPAQLLHVYEELATLLADFHLSGDTISPTELSRENCELNHLGEKTGSDPAKDGFPEETHRAVEILKDQISTPNRVTNRFSARKVICQDGTYFINDFNDLKIGKQHEDLACLLIDGKEPSDLAARFEAICEGYEIGGISLNQADRMAILSQALMMESKKRNPDLRNIRTEVAGNSPVMELFRHHCM